MPLRYLDDSGYGEGVIKDVPPWLLPKGALSDATNMIFDRPGLARQRGGISALSALGAQTAFGTSLGFARSSDDTPILELMTVSGKDGHLQRVNTATGAATDLGVGAVLLSNTTVGRSVQHFGFVIFPGSGTAAGGTASIARTTIGAGAVSATTFTNTAATNLTANSNLVTLTGADATTNIKVGHMFSAQSAGGVLYQGRVTAIVSGTTFNVWPVPTTTIAAGIGSATSKPYQATLNAVCGASFQNRLLLGGVIDFNLGTPFDRRVIYSLLPTETYTNSALPQTYTGGAVYLYAYGYPAYNFFDAPGTDPFVGMEPVSDNELLILAARRPVVFRGNLTTQQATTSQQVTFDITEMDKNAGCATDHAIQRTPRGIMWAGVDGVFVYTGSDVVNVLDGRMATYWRGLARSSTFAIHGSAYLRGHYLVSGTSGGTAFQLLINLSSREYTFAPLTGIDIFGAVLNPATPSQVFALRWWDQTGAAPSFTNGQTNRLESMLDSYVASSTKTDADGSAIAFSATSRVLTGSDPSTQKIQQRMTVRHQAAMAAASVAVTAQSRIDSADISAGAVRAIGSLSNTETRTISAATNATPIACTTSVVHGLQTGDFVDINGGLVNTHVNGRYRVTVTSTTAFTLNGSSGNGVYTASSAVMKKVTETDFMTNTLDQGQGLSVIVASSGTVNNFELHGIRTAYFEEEQVLSA